MTILLKFYSSILITRDGRFSSLARFGNVPKRINECGTRFAAPRVLVPRKRAKSRYGGEPRGGVQMLLLRERHWGVAARGGGGGPASQSRLPQPLPPCHCCPQLSPSPPSPAPTRVPTIAQCPDNLRPPHYGCGAGERRGGGAPLVQRLACMGIQWSLARRGAWKRNTAAPFSMWTETLIVGQFTVSFSTHPSVEISAEAALHSTNVECAPTPSHRRISRTLYHSMPCTALSFLRLPLSCPRLNLLDTDTMSTRHGYSQYAHLGAACERKKGGIGPKQLPRKGLSIRAVGAVRTLSR